MKDIKRQARNVLKNVEFLAGVPVSAPEKTILQIDSLLEKAVLLERERVVGLIEKARDINEELDGGKYYNCYYDECISLIINESGVNKLI